MDSATAQQEVKEVDEQLLHIKGVIESLLFVNEKPVTLDQFKKVLETVSSGEIKKAIALLIEEHEERKSGMIIVEIAGGYQMLSNPSYALYLRNFYKTKHKEKLSKPALESMAIIAYKQPVTRSDIEMIRGVNSDGVVGHLLTKELIKVIGRKDVPGRPFVYGTTKLFLEYFGLKSLDDLPTLEEFPMLQPADDDNIIELGEEDFKEVERHAQKGEEAKTSDETNDDAQSQEQSSVNEDEVGDEPQEEVQQAIEQEKNNESEKTT